MPADPRETRLLASADQVIVHSSRLHQTKGGFNPRTALIPNGVDYRAFSAKLEEPVDLAAVPHPRVGYIGVIKKQLDLALLVRLARARPGWSFVLVGPVGNVTGKEQVVSELQAMPNVYLLGGKPVDRLAAYTQHVDVCLMCYEVNDYTNYIYPLKLHEYLAAGRPTVYHHHVGARACGCRHARAVRRGMAARDHPGARGRGLGPAETERRRERARHFDWDDLADKVAGPCPGTPPREVTRRLARVPLRRRLLAALLVVVVAIGMLAGGADVAERPARKLLFIGIDGVRADVLKAAYTPYLKGLMRGLGLRLRHPDPRRALPPQRHRRAHPAGQAYPDRGVGRQARVEWEGVSGREVRRLPEFPATAEAGAARGEDHRLRQLAGDRPAYRHLGGCLESVSPGGRIGRELPRSRPTRVGSGASTPGRGRSRRALRVLGVPRRGGAQARFRSGTVPGSTGEPSRRSTTSPASCSAPCGPGRTSPGKSGSWWFRATTVGREHITGTDTRTRMS